ncbi:MAG: hypothetical protein J7573_21000, partial [Pseudomonas sp.]|nr:hypothetical protein [Pseudomonas sp.]
NLGCWRVCHTFSLDCSIACAGLFAAKAAPTGFASPANLVIPVGAALAAKRPAQAIEQSRLNV